MRLARAHIWALRAGQLRRGKQKAGVNGEETLGSVSGRGLPSFDLKEYELDPEEPWIKANGSIVWLVRRKFEFPDCSKRCIFANCPSRAKLERGSIRRATFVHVPDGHKPQKIRIEIQRWLWRGDSSVEVYPTLPHPGISPNHRMTEAAVEFTIRELRAGIAPKQLAQKLDIALSTVYLVKKESIATSEPDTEGHSVQFTLWIDPEMECVQLDDVQIGDSWYTLILGRSPFRNSFVGLIPGRTGEAVIPALKTIFARCKVKRATTDFGDYVPILKAAKPDIQITGDKWHFTEKLKKVLANVGRAAAETLTAENVDAIRGRLIGQAHEIGDRVLRAEQMKRIAGSSIGDLFDDNIDLFRTTYRKLPTERREDLAFWLKQSPKLVQIHKLLQRMYWLFNQRHLSVPEARQRFWKAVYLLQKNDRVAYQQAAFMLENRWEEILAYFETRETNARAESLIRRIRAMLRDSGGLQYGELVRRAAEKYAQGVPRYSFSSNWEQLGPAAQPVMVASRGKSGQKADSRHGKHAPKKYPLEPMPPNQPRQLNLAFE